MQVPTAHRDDPLERSDRPVALITGGSSGIGLATAKLLAAAGYHVAIVGRSEDRLGAAAAEIERPHAADDTGPQVIQLSADMADADQAAWIVAQTVIEFGRIDVLVNAAALAPLVLMDQQSVELLSTTLAVNTLAPAAAVLAAWPSMVAQQSGVIINISSMATINPFPGFFAYAASKGALNAMTRSMAVEGRAHNIRAYSIAPGAVETPMLRSIVSAADLPLERTLQPSQVAEVIMACIAGTHPAASGDLVVLPSP